MPTQFTERLTIILPVARVGMFGTWFKANIDPNDDCSTWPALNAVGGVGSAAATHVWASGAFTPAQHRALMQRLCTMAVVVFPPLWDSWTRAQKLTWLLTTRGLIRTATGIWVGHCDNAGAWERFDDHLVTMGVQRRRPPGTPVQVQAGTLKHAPAAATGTNKE